MFVAVEWGDWDIIHQQSNFIQGGAPVCYINKLVNITAIIKMYGKFTEWRFETQFLIEVNGWWFHFSHSMHGMMATATKNKEPDLHTHLRYSSITSEGS